MKLVAFLAIATLILRTPFAFGQTVGTQTGTTVSQQTASADDQWHVTVSPGLLGYRVKPKCAFLVGWRYLGVNYRNTKNIFDVASSGLIFGATFDLR